MRETNILEMVTTTWEKRDYQIHRCTIVSACSKAFVEKWKSTAYQSYHYFTKDPYILTCNNVRTNSWWHCL